MANSGADLIADGVARYLKSSGNFKLLPEITTKLKAIWETERKTAVVESFLLLDNAQKARVKKYLLGKFGEGLNFNFKQNEGLLGGLVIKVGDKVIDLSLRERLKMMEESLVGKRSG